MSKLLVRVILISVFVVALLLILFRTRSPFGSNNSSFAVENDKEITGVEFYDGKKTLSLMLEGEKWLIDGKSETRKSGILFILKILHEIKIKSPVSAELFEKEIDSTGVFPIKVKVFGQRKLLKSFLVYKTSSNIYGNIMKIKEHSKPYIMYVPGHEGDIGSAFTLNELFWQPYTVFNKLPSEIASVKFENMADTSSSFSIFNRNHNFILTGVDRELTGWDSSIVSRYLSYFTWVPFEKWGFELGEDEKKMVSSQQPIYRISVNSSEGKVTVLSLWEKMTEEDGSKTQDSDRLLGKTQNSDEIFILRYFDIDPLLKKRSYFFNE